MFCLAGSTALDPGGPLPIRPRRHLHLGQRLLIQTTARHIPPLQLQSQWHLGQRDLLRTSKPPTLFVVHPAVQGQTSNVRAPYTPLRVNLGNTRFRHVHRRPTQLRISTLSQLSPNNQSTSGTQLGCGELNTRVVGPMDRSPGAIRPANAVSYRLHLGPGSRLERYWSEHGTVGFQSQSYGPRVPDRTMVATLDRGLFCWFRNGPASLPRRDENLW